MSTKNDALLSKDVKRQYDALMEAIYGGVKRDTLANNAPKFSTHDELAVQRIAAESQILKKFWDTM